MGATSLPRTLIKVAAVALFSATISLPLTHARAGTIFTVTSAGDPGDGVCNAIECTLREAIAAANVTPGPDIIDFSIGSGLRTIMPTSALPAITDPVTIDGKSQPGFTGAPIIQLNGSLAGAGTNGIVITTDNSTVQGLVVNGWGYAGVDLEGNENLVRGNYLGTDSTGTLAGINAVGVLVVGSGNVVGGTSPGDRNILSGNRGGASVSGGFGALLSGSRAQGNVIVGNYMGTTVSGTAALRNAIGIGIMGASNNTIGGVVPEARNVIAGNSVEGIRMVGSTVTGNVIQGNYIGVDVTGSVRLSNQEGIRVKGAASGNMFGGAAPGAGNVVSGNVNQGFRINERAANNVIQGNYVGTDASGTVAIGNGQNGVKIRAADGNIIGGTVPGSRNVISGNGLNGIETAGRSVIQGNYIGTTASGTSALGNAASGVFVDSPGNTVGGTASGAGNVIAFNHAAGVLVNAGTGSAVLGNSIYANDSLGIDLSPAGVTQNDQGDADLGANGLQNFPVLSTAGTSGGSITISGTLSSLPNLAYRVEFFVNGTCDASGNGEGERLLGSGSVTTGGNGTVAFASSFAAAVFPGDRVTATATDPSNNTSEFSACVVVT